MPKCHKCPEHENVIKGVYKHKPYASTPCAKCQLSDDPDHSGRIYVSRDSSDAVDVEEALHAMPVHAGPTDAHIEQLSGFIMQLMALPPLTRDIVAFRFVNPHRPLREAAVHYRITIQAVHSRLKRALDKFPVLRKVIYMRDNNRRHE